MSVVLSRVVIRGNTIRIPALTTNYDGSALDPDSHAIRLLKPDETQEGVDMTSPTQNGTGDFHQDVDIPETAEEGEWSVEWEISVSGKLTTERIEFRVVA
jgi:uncharacterized protein YfaS (alpha-2-macroglobulin family)